MTNVVVTTLDCNFKAAFDFSFCKCAGTNKNERFNNKKLSNQYKACAVRGETEKLVKVNIEKQWPETAAGRYHSLEKRNVVDLQHQ